MRENWGGEGSHASICTGFREALMICEGELGGGEGSHASICTGFREALMICEGELGGGGESCKYMYWF